MPGYEERFDNFADCVMKIYQREGLPGYFKGLVPCYMKIIPSTALMFMVNEWLKKTFKVNWSDIGLIFITREREYIYLF